MLEGFMRVMRLMGEVAAWEAGIDLRALVPLTDCCDAETVAVVPGLHVCECCRRVVCP